VEDLYRTIERASEGAYKEKGSKFMAFAYPVADEEGIREILAALRTEYYDARHHCYAYMLGADKKRFRANDDGEPSSSAGKPILGQLLSFDVTNVLIVVVRYFGGTKLGVPGLIHAYRAAAADALAHAAIVERMVEEVVHIRFGYAVLNDVMKVVKEEAPAVLSRTFETVCEMRLSVRRKYAERLRERLGQIDTLSFATEETSL
jgi:uncharacterized YigZ family protein